MNEILTICGVECFEKDGVAYLKLETVARGLGFTQEKNGIEYIKWERVQGYLRDLKFSPEVEKTGYIPENIFYRLAMKAKNEVAENFQAKVADEIIPSIRKTGGFKLPTYPEALRQLADKTEEAERLALENETFKAEREILVPKAEFFDAVTDSKEAFPIGTVAKVLDMGIGRNKLFEFLRDEKILLPDNQPYQKYIDAGYFRVVESKFNLPNGDVKIGLKTLVFQKGVDFIRKKLIQSREAQKNE